MTKKKKPSHSAKIMALAHQSSLLRDGELELDNNAKISEGDSNGAYVQTWMWVSFDGTELDKERGPREWSPRDKVTKTTHRRKIMDLASKSSLLRDGELELDNNAKISEGDDNGAYVQAWMWVSFDGTELDKEPEE